MRAMPHESAMLREVRRWRREAYEADQGQANGDAGERLRDLAARFGLEIVPPQRAPDSEHNVPA